MRTPLFMKTFLPYLKGRQSMGKAAHYGPSEATLKTNIITVKRVGTVACELLTLARPS